MPGVSLIKTGNLSNLFNESWSLLINTEMGSTFCVLFAPFMVVTVLPVVLFDVVVVVTLLLPEEQMRGMEGLLIAATPGNPIKVDMKCNARVKLSEVPWSSSEARVRKASKFSDSLPRKNSNVEIPSGVVNIFAISVSRPISVCTVRQ